MRAHRSTGTRSPRTPSRANIGEITPAQLTVTAQSDTRGYDGSTASSIAPLLSGTTYDAVGTAATQFFDNRNAGTGKRLTASGLVIDDGNGGANYAISYVDDTTGVITPALVTVTAQPHSRGYDGSTASSIAPLLSGAIYDAVGTAATQHFDNRNAGAGKRLTASGLVIDDGNGGANYAISYVDDTTGVITPAPLTVTAQPDSRGYDGSTASSIAPLLSGPTYDPVVTSATQAFDNRNAGTGKRLSASGLVIDDGNGGANYSISYVDDMTGVITPAPLSIVADEQGASGGCAESTVHRDLRRVGRRRHALEPGRHARLLHSGDDRFTGGQLPDHPVRARLDELQHRVRGWHADGDPRTQPARGNQGDRTRSASSGRPVLHRGASIAADSGGAVPG